MEGEEEGEGEKGLVWEGKSWVEVFQGNNIENNQEGRVYGSLSKCCGQAKEAEQDYRDESRIKVFGELG